MDVRKCQVTVRDFEGIAHTVEVTASSLYEAVALGLRAIRRSAWAEENPPGPHDIVVSVSDVAVEHRVPLRKFNEWLARTEARRKSRNGSGCASCWADLGGRRKKWNFGTAESDSANRGEFTGQMTEVPCRERAAYPFRGAIKIVGPFSGNFNVS